MDYRSAAAIKDSFSPVALAATGYTLSILTTKKQVGVHVRDVYIVPEILSVNLKSYGNVGLPVRKSLTAVSLTYLAYRFFKAVVE